MEHSPTNAPIPSRLITGNLAVRVGVVVTLVIALAGIFGPVLAPHDHRAIHGDLVFSPPSTAFLLGTDHLGRDILSRLLYSFRPEVIGGALAVALGTCAAVILVALRTKSETLLENKWLPPGGILEYSLARLSVITVIAGLLPLIAIMAGLGSSFLNVIIPTALLASILPMALVYQAAGWALWSPAHHEGEQPGQPVNIPGPTKIAVRTGVTLAPVTFSVAVLMVFLLESILSVLGIGLPPNLPSVGGMLNIAFQEHWATAYWTWVFPAGASAIALAALAAMTLPVSRVQRSLQTARYLPVEGLEYAGFWVRFASILCDTSIILFVAWFVAILTYFALSPFLIVLAIVLAIVYAVFCLGGWKQSPGNWLLIIRVVRADGGSVSIWRSVLRALCIAIPPYFWLVPFNRRRRALYDVLAGTVVIKQRRA